MSDKMDDLFANVKKMVDSGNIPDDIKQMMNNFQNSNNSNTNTNNSNDVNMQEMLNNFSNMMNNNQNNNNSSTNENSNNFNIDMNTIMKMQKIMGQMNNKNDPRANLLYSLKPYLRDSKKGKLDQYVNLLNVSKIADLMNNKDNNKNE